LKHILTAAFIFASSHAIAGGQVGGGSGGHPKSTETQLTGGGIGGEALGLEGGTVGGTGPTIESLDGSSDFCVDGGSIGGGGLGFSDLIQLLIGGSGGGGTPPCDAN
jgi:hypothetical protein